MKFWVLLILFFFILSPGKTQPTMIQDPYLKFDHLTKKDGLSSNYILDIYQDKNGFIWIATINGLNRYDGYKFIQYLNDPQDSSTISDNLITCITGDTIGNIWIGTKNGLNQLNTDNTFIRYYHNDSVENTLSGNFIRALLYDNDNLWIEAADGVLHKFYPDEKIIEKFDHTKPTMIDTYYYHTIYKDKKGDLWVGGRYMGIFRFNTDKELFYEYKANPEDKTKKRDKDVATYFEDSDGTFWVSGTDGLYTFDIENETFQKTLPISTFSIQEDANKNLWIGTGNGVYILNKKKNEFRHLTHNDNSVHSLVNDHVNKIYIDRNNNVWIGTADGVSIYRPSKNKFRQINHIPENDNSPVSNHITCILEDSKNRIWIGTSSKGLECFDQDFNKLFQYSTKSKSPYQLVSDKISALMEDDDGDIWIGLWSGRGFQIVNPDLDINKHYKLNESSLKADWYNDFFQDSKSKYWIGIWGAQGLYNFDKDKGKFTDDRFIPPNQTYNSPVVGLAHDGSFIWPLFRNQSRFICLDPVTSKYSSYGRENYFSFDFTKITEAYTDNKGNVRFKTDNGIYIKNNSPYFSFSLINENFNPPPPKINEKEINNIINKKILSYIKDDSGCMWVGTYEGLYKIRGEKVEKIYRYSNENSTGLINDTIWSLDYNPPDELWIGTNIGVCMLDLKTNKFIAYNEQKEVYLSSHLISFIFEDQDEYIWVGTTNQGVNRLETKSGHIDQFKPNHNDSSAFWGDEASCIFQDSRGTIWVGGKGLNKFDPKNKSFSHITETDGLANNQVSGILEDHEGFLWVSTKSGISKMETDNLTFENFYEKDGLQDNEFSRAGFKLKNGLLLFGGKNGISVIDPENLNTNYLPPRIAITGFKLFDEAIEFNFNENKAIKFKYDQNYFSFEIAALDFSDPLLNSFAYKLENFDSDWNYTQGTNRVARYTNVDPGRYTFRIKATNMDSIWNETGLTIQLIIRPPFWKTTWFYLLEILLVISSVIFIIKFREKKIKEQNRFLILEQKLLRSQMNPHFIFNSLSSIQSFIFENNPVEAGSYLSRFAELIRSILYNSREEFITLEKEVQTLTNYLDLQKLRYDNKFDYEIDIDPLLDIDTVSIPPMMAQPFIENAIEHGIKHLDHPGLINISFMLLDETILFIVEDNGIGIHAAKKLNNIKAKEHQSLATIITRERIEILNKGQKNKKYYMEIKDSIDLGGNVKGTRIKFIIPFVKI